MALTDSNDIAKAMGVDNGPSLYLSEKNYAGVDKMSVGDEVTWEVKGIVQSVSASNYGGKGHANATVNITSIDGKDATVKPSKNDIKYAMDEDD